MPPITRQAIILLSADLIELMVVCVIQGTHGIKHKYSNLSVLICVEKDVFIMKKYMLSMDQLISHMDCV